MSSVMHLDDLYEGWSGLGGVWDAGRGPAARTARPGRARRWQRYNWAAGRFAEWHDLPVPDVLVLEGCGSAPRSVDGRAVLRLYVEAPPGCGCAVGLDRDGEAMRARVGALAGARGRAVRHRADRERADVVVDGTATLVP